MIPALHEAARAELLVLLAYSYCLSGAAGLAPPRLSRSQQELRSSL
jgi:hypothetical protein